MTAGSNGAARVEDTTSSRTELVLRTELQEPDAVVCWSNPVLVVDRADLPEVLDRRLVLLEDPQSAGARGYRLLRHRLLTAGDPRVIAVTSAVPGEGKTTCAANLALSIAEDSVGNVLLLDCNTRRPALATLFGLGPLEGVRVALLGQDAYYAVCAIGATRLHIASALTAGPQVRLDRAHLGELMRDLRGMYDYIIADAASVLDSSDADVVSEVSDGVVVTARSGSSRRRGVTRAIDELHPANVLGVVLIDV